MVWLLLGMSTTIKSQIRTCFSSLCLVFCVVFCLYVFSSTLDHSIIQSSAIYIFGILKLFLYIYMFRWLSCDDDSDILEHIGSILCFCFWSNWSRLNGFVLNLCLYIGIYMNFTVICARQGTGISHTVQGMQGRIN